MSGVIVAIAQVIQRPVAFAALWLAWATLTAAEAMGPRWPRTVLALLDIGEWCSRGSPAHPDAWPIRVISTGGVASLAARQWALEA
jgi:hypothetical protein